MILAVFDVDHTVVSGSSGGEFLRFLWKRGKLPVRNALYLAWNVRRHRRGGLDDQGLVELGARACFGLREAELEDLGRQSAADLARTQVPPEAREAVARHLAEGHHVLLASGSPGFVVEPLAAELGVHGGIGSRPRVVGGVCTKDVCLPVPFGEGKRDLVLARVDGMGVDLARSWCYSDREIDLPLMEIVGNPVAVNPKPAFAEHASRRGWRIEIWGRGKR